MQFSHFFTSSKWYLSPEIVSFFHKLLEPYMLSFTVIYMTLSMNECVNLVCTLYLVVLVLAFFVNKQTRSIYFYSWDSS